jgi:hypothetical protein
LRAGKFLFDCSYSNPILLKGLMKKLIILLLVLSSSAFVSAKPTKPKAQQHPCRNIEVRDLGENITLKIYNPRKLKSKIQAVVLPPTGGENFTDRQVSSSLCQKGIRTVLFNYSQGINHDPLDLTLHDVLTVQFLNQLRRVLADQARPTVVIGASLGGLYVSIAKGLADQKNPEWLELQWLRGAVMTVAGGSLAEILTTSTIEGVTELRNLRRKAGLFENLSQYQQILENSIALDPLYFANERAPNEVLMFISTNDEYVPTANQFQLWEAWGKPQRVVMSTNHRLTVARVYHFETDTIANFIKGLNKK